jgi:membrane-bound ClpP family serine protease
VRREALTRGAQYVGRRFGLVTPIVNGRGRIKLGDSSWAVAGPELPAGRIVEVTGVEGTVLQVRPATPEREPQAPLEHPASSSGSWGSRSGHRG